MGDISVEAAKDLKNIIKHKLLEKFNDIIIQVKKIILSEYDKLSNVTQTLESGANPSLYRDDFVDMLDNFSYIKESNEDVSIDIPDMKTFNFSGKLRVVETILNGVSGDYIEMSVEDFKSIFKRSPFIPDSKGAEVLEDAGICLIKDNDNIRNIEKHLNKKFVRYPFSNMPPFDILEKGNFFVDKNIDRWVKDVVEDAQNELLSKYKGAGA